MGYSKVQLMEVIFFLPTCTSSIFASSFFLIETYIITSVDEIFTWDLSFQNEYRAM